ncbi:MAG: hypothetical protein Q4C47_07125 [Planctomycetia bacterium]|nr:hypothetical protein [Planctomycetia bacterium]
MVGWLSLCGVLTAWLVHVFRDFVISSVLVFFQAVLEFPELPAVASLLYPGIAVFLMVAAWWKPMRMTIPVVLCAAGLCALVYGVGTLYYGPPIGFRPVNGVISTLFMAFLATPGFLRLCGFRFLSVAGLELFLVWVAISAFRGEVSSLYGNGVQFIAYGVLWAPWMVGWGLFEILRGIVLVIRHLCFDFPEEDDSMDSHSDDDGYPLPPGQITFRRRSPQRS